MAERDDSLAANASPGFLANRLFQNSAWVIFQTLLHPITERWPTTNTGENRPRAIARNQKNVRPVFTISGTDRDTPR